MTTDPTLAALEALRTELASLREEIEHLARATLSPSDRLEMKVLLPAVHSLMGATLWTVSELVSAAHAGSAPAGLAQVINAHASAEGGLRSLGRMLARVDGATSGGYRLHKVGSERQGCLYTVVRVSARPKPAAPLAPSRPGGQDAYTFVKSPTGLRNS